MTDADDVRARIKDSLSNVAARSYRAAAKPPAAEPAGVRFRLDRVLACVLAAVLLAVLAATWLRGLGGEPIPAVSVVDGGTDGGIDGGFSGGVDSGVDSGGGDTTGDEVKGGVIVHVTGAVESPGVITLEAGARVADAVEAAGGLTETADESAVNLARPVRDGEQVYVPHVGETTTGKVNINRASSTELETLPGIGPVLAERIVSDRDSKGPFLSLDDLTRVSGIGEAVMARISPLATV